MSVFRIAHFKVEISQINYIEPHDGLFFFQNWPTKKRHLPDFEEKKSLLKIPIIAV